jgi:hypothetical protein
LAQRRSRGQERAGDFFGREPADFAQGERHLRIRGQRWMAAGENEAQPIVLDTLAVRPGRRILDGQIHGVGDVVQRVESLAAPETVDRLESAGRNQPRPGIAGNPVARPLFQRRTKGIVQGLFGRVEIPEQADEGCEHPAGFGEIDSVYGLEHRISRRHDRRSHHLRWRCAMGNRTRGSAVVPRARRPGGRNCGTAAEINTIP